MDPFRNVTLLVTLGSSFVFQSSKHVKNSSIFTSHLLSPDAFLLDLNNVQKRIKFSLLVKQLNKLSIISDKRFQNMKSSRRN